MSAEKPVSGEPGTGEAGQNPYAHLGTLVMATDVIDSAYSRRRTRTIILLLAFSVGLMMTGFGIIMPVFARRLGELGSGVEGLGLMTMSFALAQFIAAPVMGSLADRSMDQVWLAAPLMVAGWLMVGGIVSLLLGIMMWRQMPFAGAWAIGVLVGIRLLMSGAQLLAIGGAAGRVADAVDDAAGA